MHRVVLLCMAVLCLTVVSVDGIIAAGLGRLQARQVSGQKCCNKIAAAPKRAKCEVGATCGEIYVWTDVFMTCIQMMHTCTEIGTSLIIATVCA